MTALDPRVTPREIVRHLDQYVIGQDEAKKTLAVAVYAHYRKLALSRDEGLEITKSNVLLVGPTGTGKTLLCESLARLLKVPFVTADATSLAQSRYVNDEIQAILERLHDKAEGEVTRTQHGIVFIDEIDKLKSASAASDRGPSGESVQHASAEDHGRRSGAPCERASTSTRRTFSSSVAEHSSGSTRSCPTTIASASSPRRKRTTGGCSSG